MDTHASLPAPAGPVLTATSARLLEEQIAQLRGHKDGEILEQLRDVLRTATVVADADALIGLGSTALVEDAASGRQSRYEIVGWHDGTKAGVVSIASPVGQALLGREAGDDVTVALPDGRVRALRVVSVGDPRGEHP